MKYRVGEIAVSYTYKAKNHRAVFDLRSPGAFDALCVFVRSAPVPLASIRFTVDRWYKN